MIWVDFIDWIYDWDFPQFCDKGGWRGIKPSQQKKKREKRNTKFVLLVVIIIKNLRLKYKNTKTK